MSSITILCSSSLPFVPPKFQIEATDGDTVLAVKKRLCAKLVHLQREGSLETSTESYNREQEHVKNPANLKLIFGGKILMDENGLPSRLSNCPTFHLHLLPINLETKKPSLMERFRRPSKGVEEKIAPPVDAMYNVRLISNQATPTVHYDIQQQSLFNMSGDACIADLKDLVIRACGKDTAVKSLDLSIQRKFVVFNSKGQDIPDDSMKVKDINSFGRPPHSQGTNVVIFYRLDLGEFETFATEATAEDGGAEGFLAEAGVENQVCETPAEPTCEPTTCEPTTCEPTTCEPTTFGEPPANPPANPFASAFTTKLNLDETVESEEMESEEMESEKGKEIEQVVAPTPTIKHMFIKDPNLGNFHLNPSDVKTGSCTESEWIAISPREMCRLKRMYREFGEPEPQVVKRRKSEEFTPAVDLGSSTSTSRGMYTPCEHQSPSPGIVPSASIPSSSSTSTSTSSSASSHQVSSFQTPTNGHTPPAPSEMHTDGNIPASDQYRQFQQFLRWADNQQEGITEPPADFDYQQFRQFIQWNQTEPPARQPLVDISFRLRVSPPPWNIRQRVREMIPPQDQLRQRAVAAFHQIGNVVVFLLQLFVFYVMVLGRINNDYMFYASCGLTVIIFLGYRFRNHLERFRPASFNLGSEELSRLTQLFPAVNYDQDEAPARNGDNDEEVRQALENPDNRYGRGARIGAAFFGSMIPAVHSQWLTENRQRRTEIRQRAIEGGERDQRDQPEQEQTQPEENE